MSSYTYRSFAIYLLIVILTPESLVSAFTYGRGRTTTLKAADPDLTAEGSALLEVKSVLSKLDNEKDIVKFGTRKAPLRSSANVLAAEKKFASGGPNTVIQSTTVKLPTENEDITKLSENETTRTEKETTSLPFGRGQTFKSRTESTTNSFRREVISSPKPSQQNNMTAEATISAINEMKETKGYGDNSSENGYDSEHSVTSTEFPDISNTDEKQTTDFRFLTSIRPAKETVFTENDNSTEETEMTKKKAIVHQSTKNFSTSPTIPIDTTNYQTDTTLNNSEEDSIATDSTALTETMVGESSSSTSQDSSWKKYTTIERKHTDPTTEPDSVTTEMAEELAKAESVSSNVTVLNTASTSPQEHQDLVSRSTTSDTGDSILSSTLPALTAPETENERLPSTRPTSAETTTEVKSREFVASRRAGYLDLSAKQDYATTTEISEEVNFNETELIGSMFEVESQDNEGPELKNSSMVESQSQLADDAIKEELMKEAVMSDHEENSKRYSDEKHDLNKVKPLESNSDESLSVKPIGKGAIYTSRSNYKPMKKIDVQPLKPFVRDPDDNSWRNESLSYLGIVFKAKNASKPFTQVLKNKTEAELNNWTEREAKNEVPDLRERLEKFSEVRKSKKKKMNQFGEMVYSDYEAENSGETSSTQKPVMDEGLAFFNSPPTSSVRTDYTASTQSTTTPGVYMYKEETVTTTKKPKKFPEYYDTTDEEDADYLSLSKIDLKKFTTRLFGMDAVTTAPSTTTFMRPMTTMLPERKPTVQYFPPRREPQKVNVNDYDNDFKNKVNMFAYSEPPKPTQRASATMPPATMEYRTTQYLKETSATPPTPRPYRPGNLAKNVYDTFPPRAAEHSNRYPSNDESFNRASYVIKHFKDLIDEAVKDDYDKSAEFMPYTEPPLVGGTVKETPPKMHMDVDYDYEANVRKDILNRFVDNFNQNSERFKVDFPILYNSSVVHMQSDDSGRVVASSSAFLKRQYGAAPAQARPCCDTRVELSPAYELHYYVPEQEEKEEAEKPATMPFSYRL